MQDTFWTEPAENHAGAAHPHLAGPGAHHAHPHAADLRRLPGPGVPHRRVRRHPQPGLPPGRGPGHRRGHHDGPPQGHARPLRRARCSARASRTRFRPSYFPFTEPSAEVDLVCFVCRGAVDVDGVDLPHLPRRGLDRVGRLRRGQPARAGRLRRRPRALHRLRVRHGHRPDPDVPPRHRGPARASSRATSASPPRSERRSDEGPRLLDPRVRRPAGRRHHRGPRRPADRARAQARGDRAAPATGITGPLVVGRVLTMEPEPQKNGKTINWCTVDVGDANGTGEPQGIVCGAHNFAPGDLVVVVPARRRAARRLRDLRAQDLRPRLRRDDLLGPRARPRRGPRRHHRAARRRRRARRRRASTCSACARRSSSSRSTPTAPTRCRCAASPARRRWRTTRRTATRPTRDVPAPNDDGYPVVDRRPRRLPGLRGPHGHRLRPGRADAGLDGAPARSRPACARSRWPSTSPTT